MTKYRFQAILFVMVAFMLGCNEYMIVGVLPDIAKEFGTSLSMLGYLVTVFAGVYAFLTPILTTVASRFRRYDILLVFMVVFLIGNTWTALAGGFWSLLWSRVLTASVSGAIISLVLILAAQLAPHDKRAGLVSWVFAGFSIASIIGIPIGTMISTTFSWHDSFWMVSLISLVVLIGLAVLVPKEDTAVKGSLVSQFSLLKDRRVLLGVGLVVSVCAGQYTFYTYIRPLLTTMMGFSMGALNWILLGMGVAFIVGNKFGGYLADVGGVLFLPYIYFMMTGLLVMLAPLVHFPWLGVLAVALVCIAVACYGSSTQLMFLDIAEKDYPQSLELASSLNSIFANIGISLGSFTAAETVSYLGLGNVGNVGAVYALLGGIAAVFLRCCYHQVRFD
ncbi:MAG: MFS transporter [Limosilactobacillus gorillae]|jgi:MFS transporter, DHA1 family, inner membrane transport protein|uniref:MFS transporter n=1 Tax=Limosilactobacillus gorillae TaxID=1450649 RepID=UPI000AA28EBB|nr:MFS transporter [Limosilactobacillus gorillae]MDO4856299.1 MFS transporter [Limosilactobacillus gorillae]